MRIISRFISEVLNPLFLLSIGAYVSVGCIVTLIAPVDINGWMALLWLSILLPLIPLLLRFRKLRQNDAAGRWWRMLLPALPIVILLLPGLSAKLSGATNMLSFHDDIQGAYINQLLHGATPIENIFLPGYPANYYWLYHAIFAPIAKLSSRHPALIAAVFNAVSVFSAALWLGHCLVELGLARKRTLHLGLAVILVCFAVNLTGIFNALNATLHGAEAAAMGKEDALRLLNLPGADARLHSLWGKMATGMGSMALGMACFCAALYVCLRALNGKTDKFDLALLSATGITALATQQVMALCIVILAAAALILMARTQFTGKPRDKLWLPWNGGQLSWRWIGVWFAISLGLSLPLLHYIVAATAHSPKTIGLGMPEARDIHMTLAAIGLLLPFAALDFAFALKHGGRTRIFLLLCAALLTLVTLTLSLGVVKGDEYKFIYALAIVMAFCALDGLRLLSRRGRGPKRLARLLFGALLLLAVLNTAWVNGVLATPRAQNFYFDGPHLSLADFNSPRAGAYYWIRRNTPVDAVVVMPLHVGLYDLLIMERLPYVKLSQAQLGDTIPEYRRRLEHVAGFYDRDASAEAYQAILSEMRDALPGRALYAVVADATVSRELMAGRGADLLMPHGSGFNVYRLNPE